MSLSRTLRQIAQSAESLRDVIARPSTQPGHANGKPKNRANRYTTRCAPGDPCGECSGAIVKAVYHGPHATYHGLIALWCERCGAWWAWTGDALPREVEIPPGTYRPRFRAGQPIPDAMPGDEEA